MKRVVANVIHPPSPGRGGDDHGPGRGRGHGGCGGAAHEVDNDSLLHCNDTYHHRDHHDDDWPKEEKFGKLKFSMPKYAGGNDLEENLTWELKVVKVFCIHNYTKDKKLAMASLEFDDYTLIW